MLTADVKLVSERLNGLAEVYAKPAVTEKAFGVWFETLKEFPTDRVMMILNGWPKQHGRFPTPAEVWKECNEKAIEDREKRAAHERKLLLAAPEYAAPTAEGRALLARMRLEIRRPKLSPVQHWERLLAKPGITDFQRRFAIEALGNLSGRRPLEREPGQDDEELAA